MIVKSTTIFWWRNFIDISYFKSNFFIWYHAKFDWKRYCEIWNLKEKVSLKLSGQIWTKVNISCLLFYHKNFVCSRLNQACAFDFLVAFEAVLEFRVQRRDKKVNTQQTSIANISFWLWFSWKCIKI